VGVESRFPEVIESTAGADAAKSQDMFRPGYAPEHARLFAASADDGLTASFDDPRTNEEATAAESAILHARHVADEVTQFLFYRLNSGGAGAFLARGRDELFDFISE
jgi:hypothetical protein